MLSRFRRKRDFEKEIESHLAIETDRMIAEGLSPDEARHAARRSFGNVTTRLEHFHAKRPTASMENASRNLRYAIRGLIKRPAFALSAIITLAFGIGVNSALFTLFYSLVWRPPPVAEPSRHVNVSRDVNDDGRGYSLNVKGRASMLSWPDYVRLREGAKTLEQLAVYRRQTLRLDAGDQTISLDGQFVSCNYFAAAGLSMSLGRPLVADECKVRGTGAVAVLAHGYWKQRFGSDSSIIGRTLRVNQQAMQVVGVAAPGFQGLAVDGTDVWVPISMYGTLMPASAADLDQDISMLTAFGRMRPGVAVEQVKAELTTLVRREDTNWPGRVTRVEAATGSAFLDKESRTNVLIATSGATIFGILILVMCCANVMNLLLARAAARRREIGIRLSLGATRSKIISQLMIESAVLATFGGALGLVLAWLLPPLIRLSAPDQQLNLVLTPDVWILVATMAIALGSTLLFGLIPALQSTNAQLTAVVRGEAGSQSNIGRAARWRTVAVVTQVSVSALLLVTSAMFLRAAQRSFSVAPGFRMDGVSSVNLDFGRIHEDSSRARLFYATLRDEMARAPGVEKAALAAFIPMRGRGTAMVDIRGDAGKATTMQSLLNEVSTDYFGTLNIPLVSGRVFTDEETAGDIPVVVNEAFARSAWPRGDALGKAITLMDKRMVVVGIVRDVQSVSLGLQDGPYIYAPASRQLFPGSMQLLLRTNAGSVALEELVTRLAREVDPTTVVTVRTLEQELERLVAPVRLTGQVTSALGLTALLLAAIGVYGVIAFTVSQRSREIGIRMALGATGRMVQGMVLRQGARVVGIGLAIGVVAAIGTSFAIRSVLFGLSAVDAVALLSVIGTLSAVAAVAVMVPANRAARVDPMTSLREE